MLVFLLTLSCYSKMAEAVVGQAERFDEFKEEELKEFQDNLTREEASEQTGQGGKDLTAVLSRKRSEAKKAKGEEKDALMAEIEALKKTLLQLPPRDRFKIEMSGQQKYESNVARKHHPFEKDDNIFDTKTTGLVDLSGRKTDMRFESGFGRQWNITFSEKDTYQVDGRLRFRRNYFKKLTNSSQMNLSRNSSKTVEINDPKIRWDNAQSSAWNYAFSQKMSINNEGTFTKRYFPQEAFDQDSSWESAVAPSAFWNFTPKSRISAGYSAATNRIRSKAGNTNARNIRIGYFGKVTKKSSASVDLALNHQTPKSKESAKSNTYTAGLGFIWQMTPKTQLTTQYIRSVQNTTSDLLSGEVNGSGTTSKQDSHFYNDSISFSLNSRLASKLTAVLTFNMSTVRTRVEKDGNKENETLQMSFPATFSANYVLARWARLSTSYTFGYRTGNEKPDKNRAHTLITSMNVSY